MLASEIMQRARVILQDEESVRWPLSELCDWLNDGLREIARQVPSAFSTITDLTLAAGAKQTLPSGVTRMLRPIVNAPFTGDDGYPRLAVTVVSQDLLNAVLPGWHDPRRYKQQAKHVMFDEASPRTYYVYPPNDGTGKLRALVASKFTPVVASDEENVTGIDKYASEVPVEDAYGNALVDYVLYRAFSKDAQFADTIQRASAHFTQFASAVNMAVGTDANMSPNKKPGIGSAPPGVVKNA